MKKIILTLSVCFLLTGCSGNESNDIVIENNLGMHALVNGTGELVADFKYIELDKLKSNYVGISEENIELINENGKIISQFELSDLKVVGELFAITTTHEDKSITTIYNQEGKVLYQSGGDTTIRVDDLFVVTTGERCVVLGETGTVLFESADLIENVSLNNNELLVSLDSGSIVLNYPDPENQFDLGILGDFEVVATNNVVGDVLYDRANRRMVVLDLNNEIVCDLVYAFDRCYFDELDNLILVESTENIVVDLAKETLVDLNSYYYNSDTYVVKNNNRVYGPHQFYHDGAVVEVNDIQLAPYGSLTNNALIPVYLRDQGFTYYNYDGTQAIMDFYDEVSPFTSDNVAIVKRDGQYALIDEKGSVLVSNKESISIIAPGFYGAYSDNTSYQVISRSGELLIDDTFVGSGEIYRDMDHLIGVFAKAGVYYVYDMSEGLEIFHYEGEVVYQDGYLYGGDEVVFDLEGNIVYQRGE